MDVKTVIFNEGLVAGYPEASFNGARVGVTWTGQVEARKLTKYPEPTLLI